jgi:SAM-dependent methyltransferase
LLAGRRGKYPPHVLDIGCGTGRVLDLGLVAPDRYAGVDSSQAMLNLMLRKHSKVGAAYPVDIRQALDVGIFTPRQFDWAFLDGAVELNPEQRAQAQRIARLAAITVDKDEWTVLDSESTLGREYR